MLAQFNSAYEAAAIPTGHKVRYNHEFSTSKNVTYKVIVSRYDIDDHVDEDNGSLVSIVERNGDQWRLVTQGNMPEWMHDDTFTFSNNQLVHSIYVVATSVTRYDLTSTYVFSESSKRYILKKRYRVGTLEYERNGNWFEKNVNEPYDKESWGKETLP